MKVGDLVKVVYDGTVGLVAEIDYPPFSPGEVWVYLYTGESFRADRLEVISESR